MLSRPHPRSPEGCSAGVLSVNGERRLRSRFATVIPGGLGGASWRTKTPRARSLNPPGAAKGPQTGESKGKRGAKVRQTPQWSAVRRGRPIARLVACFIRAGIPGAPYGALLPLSSRESDQRTAQCGAETENQDGARADFRSEFDGACAPGCLTIGSGENTPPQGRASDYFSSWPGEAKRSPGHPRLA